MYRPEWIWELSEWPLFSFSQQELSQLLRDCTRAQGVLAGLVKGASETSGLELTLDAMLENILTSSAIEGEVLNVESVRSSLAKRLGVPQTTTSVQSEGLSSLLLDCLDRPFDPLTFDRLCKWHSSVFPVEDSFMPSKIKVGQLRGNDPMQVVSGPLTRQKVHFEAPPRDGLEQRLEVFLAWFESSRTDSSVDPLIRAGIAHFWFVTLHPFDDGNGRLTRAITDMALAQSDPASVRLYAMSSSILKDRACYYRVLESSQRGSLDITAWLAWFLATLLNSLTEGAERIERVVKKTRFWAAANDVALLPEQKKVLNRLLDGGESGFEDGISASQYQKVAKVAKATASRHLVDLVDKGLLVKTEAGGRSTRYKVAML